MGFQRFLDKIESGDGDADIDLVLFALILIGAAIGVAARYFIH